MVAQYTVFGRQVGSHVLAMITLGTVIGGSALAMSGGKKEDAGPPIGARSKEEESFIKDFVKKAQSDDKSKH